jgi:aspartate carbamoyltransferase regulatory subunit
MKNLSVTAIENGTVIDHIQAGQGMRIVRLLKLADHKKKVTLGLNLPSKTLGHKDIIKAEEREITEEEANQIAVFAPKATINIIRGYHIERKFSVSMPDMLARMLTCPNQRCVTNHEDMQTRFKVNCFGKQVILKCHYCEKAFTHDAY